MSKKIRRLLVCLVLLGSSSTTFLTPSAFAAVHQEGGAKAVAISVSTFQQCNDVVTSKCIVSVKNNEVDLQFVGNVSSSQAEMNCEITNLDVRSPGFKPWCYTDSVPAYSSDATQFARGEATGLKVLLVKSPNASRAEISGGPSFNIDMYGTVFQPVAVERFGGSGVNGEKIAKQAPSTTTDAWTIKINFGPVPVPNFYAQAQVDSYITTYDASGNTIVEVKILPILLTFPGNGQSCKETRGTFDSLTIGLTSFRSTLPEGDSMRKRFSFTNGFSVASNSVCATGGFRIADDGSVQIAVDANHLRADGSMYEGYFSAVVSPLALQGFNVSPDLVSRGGLKIVRSVGGETSQLESTTVVQPDGSVRISATGFHYSAGSISIVRNKKLALPSKTVAINGTVGALKVGKKASVRVTAKGVKGRVHVSLAGLKGQKWSLGSQELVNGSSEVSVVIPKSFPRGRTSLIVWYEGSNTVRPTTKIVNVTVR